MEKLQNKALRIINFKPLRFSVNPFVGLWCSGVAYLIFTAVIGIQIPVVAVKFHNADDYTIERHPWPVSENHKPTGSPKPCERNWVVTWVTDETQD